MIVENTIAKKVILVKEELESKISAAVLTQLYEMKTKIAKNFGKDSDKKDVGETGVDADDVDEVE